MPHHRRIAAAYSKYLVSVRGNKSDSATKAVAGDGKEAAEGLGDAFVRTEAREYEDDYYKWTAHYKRFIVTDKGFYGLGTQLVREGDVVAVFTGFMVPFVLRETGEMEKYNLIESNCVHAAMSREILDTKDPLGMQE